MNRFVKHVISVVSAAVIAFGGVAVSDGDRNLATAAPGLGGSATSVVAPAAQECPSGYVCLIKNGAVVNAYYTYGAHNLSNKFGSHWVFNNQTGGAHVHLCYSYGGVNCFEGPLAGRGAWHDLTPINSVFLHS